MRVSYVVPRCLPDNSHGRYVIELAVRLSTRHRVTVYSGAFLPSLRSIVTCRTLPVPNRPAVVRLAALWMSSLIATGGDEAAIVHVQGADAPTGNVITTASCNALVRRATDSGGGAIRRFNHWLGAAAEHYCLRRPSVRLVLAVSEKAKRDVVEHYGVDQAKVVVIPLGVDSSAFHPSNVARFRVIVRESLGVPMTDFVILFVGGDYRLKGLSTLLQALELLPEEVSVVALGVVPDRHLKAICLERKLSKRVKFVQHHDQPACYYAAADCFVLPTRYDTFSLATLEAMAAGLPVIVSGDAGVSEHIVHEQNGFVLEDCRDPVQLTSHLSRIIDDKGVRDRIGGGARRTAERLSWDSVADHTHSAYLQLK